MASATYLARRGLVSYHMSGGSYSIDFGTTAIARPNGSDLKHKTESLSGAVETLFFGERRIWAITTVPMQISSAQAQLMYEFLRSTADGQEFVFDPYGNGGLLTVIREDDGYTESPFSEIDGVNDYVRFGFQVREV